MELFNRPIKGRGAQKNTPNPYTQHQKVLEHWEGIDEPDEQEHATKYVEVFPKTIINKVDSPDIGLAYSLNPYQGCEHGCIYCYARNSHQFWGYSAGLDFERVIMVKKNAPLILEETFKKPNWIVEPVMFSGNTDCYQPIERKLQITRKCLEVFLKFRHPVGLITKNSLIERDLDLLQELNQDDLVHVNISLNTLNEDLRRVMEPRTATIAKRLQVIENLSKAGIPVNVMIAPVIPGLNNHEILNVAKAVSEAGANSFAHLVVRLNGNIGEIFADWIQKQFPDRAKKVLSQVASMHGGKLNDSRYGTRMRGEGNIAKQINDMAKIAKQKYFKDKKNKPFNTTAFIRTPKNGQLGLFGS